MTGDPGEGGCELRIAQEYGARPRIAYWCDGLGRSEEYAIRGRGGMGLGDYALFLLRVFPSRVDNDGIAQFSFVHRRAS
jgi:hypothetical protein